MNQFVKDDLVVALPGRGYTDQLFRVDMALENGQICVDFGGVVKLADAHDFRLAKPEEIILTGCRIEEGEVLPVDDEFLPLDIFFTDDEQAVLDAMTKPNLKPYQIAALTGFTSKKVSKVLQKLKALELVTSTRAHQEFGLSYHWNKVEVTQKQRPDIIELPFVAGLGAEGSYGMSDKELAQHQQDSQARHSRMCRNLIIIALLLVAVIAGMNWWVA